MSTVSDPNMQALLDLCNLYAHQMKNLIDVPSTYPDKERFLEVQNDATSVTLKSRTTDHLNKTCLTITPRRNIEGFYYLSDYDFGRAGFCGKNGPDKTYVSLLEIENLLFDYLRTWIPALMDQLPFTQRAGYVIQNSPERMQQPASEETTTVIVERRSLDWHASFKTDQKIWGCGKTPTEAVGDLVRSYPEAFRLTFEEKPL